MDGGGEHVMYAGVLWLARQPLNFEVERIGVARRQFVRRSDAQQLEILKRRFSDVSQGGERPGDPGPWRRRPFTTPVLGKEEAGRRYLPRFA